MVTVETKPVWSSSSFLIYTGGLTVLEGAFLALVYLSMQFPGNGQGTAWTLLILVILAAIAYALRRAGEWLAAGIFAFNTVIAWGLFVGITFGWWGWTNGSFGNIRVWSWPRLLLEVLVLVAATSFRRRFKFPFIRAISALVGTFFVFDLLTKFHGNPLAVVALFLGLFYLVFGSISRKPSTFWLHLVAGLLIGVPIVYWAHHTTFDYAVIAFMSLVYVIWAYATKRSSWAVFGTVGFYIAAGYYIFEALKDTVESDIRSAGPFTSPLLSVISDLWFIPLAIGLLGFWLVLLGMLAKRKRDDRAPVTTEIKPIWTASSFLVYAGGSTVLLGAIVGLTYLGIEYRGNGERTAWTLLFVAIVYGLAHVLRRRGRWLAAGVFAFVSVLLWALLVLVAMRWFGWHPFTVLRRDYGSSPFGPFRAFPFRPAPAGTLLASWSWSRMLFWVLVLAAAAFDRRVFRFPGIRLISAVVAWLFVSDLLTSGHGNWFVVVALLTGLVYLVLGHVLDTPSAYWLHLIGGALIGGSLLHWFHTSDGDFALISIVSLLFVLVAYATTRSSWAVYATIGFFLATDHYLGLPGHTGVGSALLGVSGASECSASMGLPPTCVSTGPFVSLWSVALGYGLLGFWLVGLGVLAARKRGSKPAPAVVTPPPPAPPAEPAPAG